MSRYGNFRNRARNGYNSFKQRSSGFRRRSSRTYRSNTLGMKNSNILKLAVVGGLLYFFKDKIKPFINSLTNKK